MLRVSSGRSWCCGPWRPFGDDLCAVARVHRPGARGSRRISGVPVPSQGRVVDTRHADGQPHGQTRPFAVHPSALSAPLPAVTHLTATDLHRRLAGAVSLRALRRHLARWSKGGWPRVVQVPRNGKVGGWQWAVIAEDYDRMVRGLGPPPEARAAA